MKLDRSIFLHISLYNWELTKKHLLDSIIIAIDCFVMCVSFGL